MTLGNCIWAGNSKEAKFTEPVAMEADGEAGRAGVAVVGDWVFLLALGGNQCFVKMLGLGLHLGEEGWGVILWARVEIK